MSLLSSIKINFIGMMQSHSFLGQPVGWVDFPDISVRGPYENEDAARANVDAVGRVYYFTDTARLEIVSRFVGGTPAIYQYSWVFSPKIQNAFSRIRRLEQRAGQTASNRLPDISKVRDGHEHIVIEPYTENFVVSGSATRVGSATRFGSNNDANVLGAFNNSLYMAYSRSLLKINTATGAVTETKNLVSFRRQIVGLCDADGSFYMLEADGQHL